MVDEIRPEKSPEDLKRLRDLQLGDFPPNMTENPNPLNIHFPIVKFLALCAITFLLSKAFGVTYGFIFICLSPVTLIAIIYSFMKMDEIGEQLIEVDFYDKRKTSFIFKIKDRTFEKEYVFYSEMNDGALVYSVVSVMYMAYCNGSGSC